MTLLARLRSLHHFRLHGRWPTYEEGGTGLDRHCSVTCECGWHGSWISVQSAEWAHDSHLRSVREQP